MSRITFGASVAALAGAMLFLTPASAFTLGASSPGRAAVASPAERIWWDRWGNWQTYQGWRPAQPHYHCWKPLHGPRRCQFDY